jgi:hypothetical protein
MSKESPEQLKARGIERFAPFGNMVIDVYAPDWEAPFYAQAKDYEDAIRLAKELNDKENNKAETPAVTP